jgi:hypothetical protein
MSKRHLPSIEALTSSDDEAWIAELKLSEVREQVAAARSMLDAIAVSETGQPSSDFVQSLAQVGCRFVEIAGLLSRAATQCSEDDEARRRGFNALNLAG